jgi:hypothetical protein
MNCPENIAKNDTTRRKFLKTTSQVVVGAALTPAIARPGYTAEDNTFKVTLVGCGGRGTGAVANALATLVVPSNSWRWLMFLKNVSIAVTTL